MFSPLTYITIYQWYIMRDKINVYDVVRSESDYTIDSKLANKLTNTLNKIKGRVDIEISSSGKLDVNEYIKFRINKKSGDIPKLNIFNQTVEKNGLDVFLILDCSLSMYQTHGKLNNIAASIFQALENCTFINFKCICYSGDYDQGLAIQELTKVNECRYITPDEINRSTPTHLILNYIHDQVKKSENKKLVILFTDGLPEDNMSLNDMQLDIKKQIVKMKNDKINFFTIFYQNHKYNKMHFKKGWEKQEKILSENMRNMFKGSLYETDDFDNVQKVLIKQLIKSVENINTNE